MSSDFMLLALVKRIVEPKRSVELPAVGVQVEVPNLRPVPLVLLHENPFPSGLDARSELSRLTWHRESVKSAPIAVMSTCI